MESAISLAKVNNDFFKKVIDDLKYALKDLSSEELFLIFKDSAISSLKVTYNTKKDSLKRTSDFIKSTVKRYHKDGIIQSAQDDAKRINDFIALLPGKAKDVYLNFLKLSRGEQIEVVSVTILTVAIFFASAGGIDLEGGLPDTDIAVMGIQHHRNFISHSILIGLGVEFTGRFSLNMLEKVKNRMPIDRHPVWDSVYNFIDKHKNKAIAAMWLGISAHLLKDSGIFGVGVSPYKDLPFSMPIEAHQGLFAANGAASTIFSIKM
ncbi:MAG: hypothetical protein ACYDEE_09575 [Ignavibacteriaceae bacterium]